MNSNVAMFLNIISLVAGISLLGFSAVSVLEGIIFEPDMIYCGFAVAHNIIPNPCSKFVITLMFVASISIISIITYLLQNKSNA